MKKSMKTLMVIIAVVFLAFGKGELAVSAGQNKHEVIFIFKDDVTGGGIAGITVEIFEKDMNTGAIGLSLGTHVTDGSGEVKVGVDEYGTYVAKYVSGLDATIFDTTQITTDLYEVDVTKNKQPGVQLVEKWSEEYGKFSFRDVITDGDYVIVSGKFNGASGEQVPATIMENNIPHTMTADRAVALKINAVTGKVTWVTQYPSAQNGASYSIIKSRDGNYYATAFGNDIFKIDTTGTATSVPVNYTPTGVYSNERRIFDVTETIDGYAIAGSHGVILEYDGTTNPPNVIDVDAFVRSKSAVASSQYNHIAIKSIEQLADRRYVVSGSLELHQEKGGYIAVIDPANPSKSHYFEIGTDAFGTSTKARINSFIHSIEGGVSYLVFSGNLPGLGSTYTIPAADTTGTADIVVGTSSNAQSTAFIGKIRVSDWKVDWIQSFGGSNTASTSIEQQFNAVTLAQDSVGGYTVSGQVSGKIIVPAINNFFGKEIQVQASVGNSDAIIARYSKDGLFVDSYLYGSATANDEYYGTASTPDWIYAVGNDASKNIVALSVGLTSSPRTIIVPTLATATSYMVEHYQESSGIFKLVDSSQHLGAPGGAINFTPNSYAGFKYDAALTKYYDSSVINGDFTPLLINSDGSSIVKLYYVPEGPSLPTTGVDSRYILAIIAIVSGTALFIIAESRKKR